MAKHEPGAPFCHLPPFPPGLPLWMESSWRCSYRILVDCLEPQVWRTWGQLASCSWQTKGCLFSKQMVWSRTGFFFFFFWSWSSPFLSIACSCWAARTVKALTWLSKCKADLLFQGPLIICQKWPCLGGKENLSNFQKADIIKSILPGYLVDTL